MVRTGTLGNWPWDSIRRRSVSDANRSTADECGTSSSSAGAAPVERRTSSIHSAVERNRRGLAECYHVGDVIGCGAFSVVHRAVCKNTGTAWAVKIIAGACRDAALREVANLSQLNHANVLRAREYFDDPTGFALVCELLDGDHLLQHVADRGSYAEDDCRQIARGVLSALAHCHAEGIVHRDLKLENLVLSCSFDPSSVKIVNFGLAGKISAQNPFLTESCGTPAYAAPEVLKRNPAYGSSPDVWSVGCLVFTLLSGAPPFQSSLLAHLVRDIRQGAFSMSDPAWELISDGAKDFVKVLLTVRPENRPTARSALEHPWLQD